MRRDITGMRVAIILMREAFGVPENVVHGTVVERPEGLCIQHQSGLLILSDDWASRIGPLEPASSRTRIGADCVLPLLVDRLRPVERASLVRAGLEPPPKGAGGRVQ